MEERQVSEKFKTLAEVVRDLHIPGVEWDNQVNEENQAWGNIFIDGWPIAKIKLAKTIPVKWYCCILFGEIPLAISDNESDTAQGAVDDAIRRLGTSIRRDTAIRNALLGRTQVGITYIQR